MKKNVGMKMIEIISFYLKTLLKTKRDIDRKLVCESTCESDHFDCVMHCEIDSIVTCLDCADKHSKCLYGKYNSNICHQSYHLNIKHVHVMGAVLVDVTIVTILLVFAW